MNEAIWATWYDLPDEGREASLAWLHAHYLPFLTQQPGYAWAAHYRNVGPGPSLASYHDFAGHTPDSEGVETGSQYVILVGAASTHTFLKPVFTELAMPLSFAPMLAKRMNLRQVIFAEEARVNGPASEGRLPGSTPSPAIQFGTYRIRSFEEELSLNMWYAHERFPLMSRMPGSVLTRKFVSMLGWAKHGVLYEFDSLESRTLHFEEPHESRIVDPKAWVGKVVRSTLHTPGSPVVGERIWPPVIPIKD